MSSSSNNHLAYVAIPMNVASANSANEVYTPTCYSRWRHLWSQYGHVFATALAICIVVLEIIMLIKIKNV